MVYVSTDVPFYALCTLYIMHNAIEQDHYQIIDIIIVTRINSLVVEDLAYCLKFQRFS